MVRADLFVFGYFSVTLDASDIRKASDILIKNGISAKINSDGNFLIPYRYRERLEKLFFGKVNYKISEPSGLFGALIKNKNKIGVFIGLFIIGVLLLFSSNIVWDVRIEGADGEDTEKILLELKEAGLSAGKMWNRLDLSEIEHNTLIASDSVSWLNINRRGSVAYVKVSDKILHIPEPEPDGYANIVAVRDCVIEEIIVKRGYAMVKKGETVKKGQVLISGVIPTELGGGFCYAEGEVNGIYTDTVSVDVKNEKTEKEYGKRSVCKISLNFFGKNINIFKKHRQVGENCDIIEEKEDLVIGKKLPISVIKDYTYPYELISTPLSSEEMVFLAAEMLKEKMAEFLSDKEAKRLKTGGEFYDGGYRMLCEAVVCSSVTKIQEFKVSLE